MRIATYNLRYDNAGDASAGNGWARRCPVIADLIRFHDFDIFGTQEGLARQLRDLQGRLPGYSYVGVGRDDGKDSGEHSAIFYKSSQFTVLSHGDFWMAPVTNRPNKGWDAALPRLCTWAKFRTGSSGREFYWFNLHMDHIGAVARRESARLVLDTIRKMAGKTPVVLTGDFNIDQENESYALINNSGFLRDAYVMADMRAAYKGTFNAFNPSLHSESRIDHIFLSNGFSVSRYGILTDSYTTTNGLPGDSATTTNRLPSDHYPVMAVIRTP